MELVAAEHHTFIVVVVEKKRKSARRLIGGLDTAQFDRSCHVTTMAKLCTSEHGANTSRAGLRRQPEKRRRRLVKALNIAAAAPAGGVVPEMRG